MLNEQKQQFTFRISNANKTDLVIIVYDMILVYVEDARQAHEDNDSQAFKEAIRNIRNCTQELIASLHFEYELAARLLSLYIYINRELVKTNIHYDDEALEHVVRVITQLRDAYGSIAGENKEAPIMQNTQAVYAGLTYNKGYLNESVYDDSNRGVFA